MNLHSKPRELLLDLYLQVTTISWLSVRSVQRSSQPQAAREERTNIFDLLSSIFDLLPSWSDILSTGREEAGHYQDTVESRAEERLRRARELEVNNSKARANLAVTKILRSTNANKQWTKFNWI